MSYHCATIDTSLGKKAKPAESQHLSKCLKRALSIKALDMNSIKRPGKAKKYIIFN